MALNHWKQLFSQTILNRGREYFNQGLVESLDYDERGITAVVCGSYDYAVDITFAKNEVKEISCDCPYAEDGYNCKHMAAVLYEWEDKSKNYPSTITMSKRKISVEDAVCALPEESVRSLLLQYAKEIPSLREKLISLTVNYTDKKHLHTWNKELMLLQRSYGACEGYLNYYDTYNYFSDLTDFLDKKISILMQTELFSKAFELICEVYDATDVECDDYSDSYYVLIDQCKYYLKQIIQNSDLELKHKLYQECLSRCGGTFYVDNDEIWQDTLFNGFADDEFLYKNIRLIDRALQDTPCNTDKYQLLQLVQYKLGIMYRLNYTKDEITNFLHQYRSFPEIRRIEWKDAIEKNNFPYAIQLLKESKKIDAQQPNWVNEYSRQLIELYEKQNDLASCRTELSEYIFTRSHYELNQIQKLKNASTHDQWKADLEKILKLDLYPQVRYELMVNEEMYRELLSELETDPYLTYLPKYEMLLKPLFTEEIRDVFFAYLRFRMDLATSRSAYAEIIQRLKKMETYPNGEIMSQTLADEWRENYKRRSALLDELNKAGFVEKSQRIC